MRFLKPYLKKHFPLKTLLPKDHSTPTPPPNTTTSSPRLKWKVRILQLIFPFSLLLFLISFLWDFSEQHTLTLFEHTYSFKGLLRTLSVSSIIGYGTNWLAIKMLFYPKTPHPILGQGLIPATKRRIAQNLATNLTQSLLNPELIKQELNSQNYADRISSFLVSGTKNLLNDPHFRHELANEVYKITSSFFQKSEIKEKISFKLKETILQNPHSSNWLLKTYLRLYKHQFETQVNYLITQLPQALSQFIRQNNAFYESFLNYLDSLKPSLQKEINEWLLLLIEHLPIQTFLEKQLLAYEEDRLEKLIWSSSSDQFRYVRDLGGFLGLIGGLILWQPLLLIPLATLTGLLFLLDWILNQKKIDKK